MPIDSRRPSWRRWMAEVKARSRAVKPADPDPSFDWRRIAYLVQLSRALDKLEETELVPQRKILYQFSARGHDMAQVLLGSLLTHRRDAACGYYRSRPLLLALGVPPVEACLDMGAWVIRTSRYRVVFTTEPNGCPASDVPRRRAQLSRPPAGARRDLSPRWARRDGIAADRGGSAATRVARRTASGRRLLLRRPECRFSSSRGQSGRISVPSTYRRRRRHRAQTCELRRLKSSRRGTDPTKRRGSDTGVGYFRGVRGRLLRITVPRSRPQLSGQQTYKSEASHASEWRAISAQADAIVLPVLDDWVVSIALSEAPRRRSRDAEARRRRAVAGPITSLLGRSRPAAIGRWLQPQTRPGRARGPAIHGPAIPARGQELERTSILLFGGTWPKVASRVTLACRTSRIEASSTPASPKRDIAAPSVWRLRASAGSLDPVRNIRPALEHITIAPMRGGPTHRFARRCAALPVGSSVGDPAQPTN